MTVPFKFLPHEILNKHKPAPTIRIYSQAPHEIFTPKPTEKSTTSPKPVNTIHACLWSQNPQPTNQKKKKEKEGDPHKPISHQTKNRGVWKSTRAADVHTGITRSRTTYANSPSAPLPPCRFMLHKFHHRDLTCELWSAPSSTVDNERRWAHTASQPLTLASLRDCSATFFSLLVFFASSFFSFGVFNVWT